MVSRHWDGNDLCEKFSGLEFSLLTKKPNRMAGLKFELIRIP